METLIGSLCHPVPRLYNAFKAAAERAKLPPEFVQHDLRHRRVTKWLADEKSAVLVREAIGHADLRTTMAYTHLAREHLRALVEEVAGHASRRELRDLAYVPRFRIDRPLEGFWQAIPPLPLAWWSPESANGPARRARHRRAR